VPRRAKGAGESEDDETRPRERGPRRDGVRVTAQGHSAAAPPPVPPIAASAFHSNCHTGAHGAGLTVGVDT